VGFDGSGIANVGEIVPATAASIKLLLKEILELIDTSPKPKLVAVSNSGGLGISG
jgi:hypothetical protein